MMINSKYIFTDEEQVAKLQLEIKELENKIAELTDERDSLLEIINTKNVSKLIAKLPCNNYSYLETYQAYKFLHMAHEIIWKPWEWLYDFINYSSLTAEQIKELILDGKNGPISAEMLCRMNYLFEKKKLSIHLKCIAECEDICDDFDMCTKNCITECGHICDNFDMCAKKCIEVICDGELYEF